MAELLIEKWRLAVLRVRLDVSDAWPEVVAELVTYTGDEPHTIWTSRLRLEEFGLSSLPGPPRDLRVPATLRDRIGESLYGPDLKGETSLWLRLVPPYGYLGAVPWETALLEVTDVPLVRVPDRLPLAADPGERWTVAIGLCAWAGQTWSGPYLSQLVHRIHDATAPAEIDVFADATTVLGLRELRAAGLDWLHIHEPADARPASADRSRRLGGDTSREFVQRSAGQIWADWIVTGLAGRAVRALHVVLNATWDAERPVLSFGTDPSDPGDATTCGFAAGEEIARLADAVGAGTLSFGSPPVSSPPPDQPAAPPADLWAGDPGDPQAAMRGIADTIGQQRAGATIYTAIDADPDGSALASAHAFLAGRSTQIPRHRSMFAYLQPGQVRPALAYDWPVADPVTGPLPVTVIPTGYAPDPVTDVSNDYSADQTVPTWVAASERYISSRLAELSQPASAPEPVPYKQAYDDGAAAALSELHALIAKHARPQ